ncbi:aldehyde dehydrogenase [candidate division KSB1 bacterium]|nr:aldehyde dehydrogenase [candidate division KSB1 bacterium]
MTPDSRTDMIVSINPSTLEEVGRVPHTHPEDVPDLVQKAREAYPAWRDKGIDARIEIMKRAQDLLLKQAEEIAELITLEMGRPFTEALTVEVEASVDLLYYDWKHAHRFLRNRRVWLHHPFFMLRKSYIHCQPLGVLTNITPWNWPLLIPLGVIGPALLSGNAMLFKPSEYTPLTGDRIRDLFIQAGVPEDIFINLHGSSEVGQALVFSDTEKVFFTGSTNVGQIVMEQGAPSLKKIVLELGGHDPAIVCEDADVDISSSGVLWGAMNNCGQNCNGIERVYMHENVADRFTDLLVEKTQKLRIGDGMDPDTDIGPLATELQFEKILSVVQHAQKSGMEILTGGNPIQDKKGYYFEPTVIRCDPSGPEIPDDEAFGPVVFVRSVQDDVEAIRLANDSQFGLAGSVWTSNSRHGQRIAQQIESGSVMVNDSVCSFGITEAGWTGIKKSGVGWMHGEKGLDEMVNMQFINIDTNSKSQNFWWFPYGPDVLKGIRVGMTLLFDRNWFKKLATLPAILCHLAGYLLINRKQSKKL